jgi:glutamine---fructose-6-phosphate transaminase (isomerizing)
MCGIFGCYTRSGREVADDIRRLASFAQERGSDSAGFTRYRAGEYDVLKGDMSITRLLKEADLTDVTFAAGHSRLATNGVGDNQPIVKDGMVTIHNGIICNVDDLWKDREGRREFTVDSEIIPVILAEEMAKGGSLEEASKSLFEQCEGVICAAVLVPASGELFLVSNNGSLYTGYKGDDFYFASEAWPLTRIGCAGVSQLKGATRIEVPKSSSGLKQHVVSTLNRPNLLPEFHPIAAEEALLDYQRPEIRRCSRCILPATMPFIQFDSAGVCNYCHNYTTRNQPKPIADLESLMAPHRRAGVTDCIVPFSGGRDSCYGLHLVVKELGMNPIAYTYDWGMVTDLGRRNISKMCAALGVENIIIAADIELKRRNINKNLTAWLKKPHLGMIALLTAGDKHFFRHVETVKDQTGVSLNLWGVNPLEVTHFKTGFLGIPPAFAEKRVYSSGLTGQFNYHRRRFWQMLLNPGYLNRSLFDTLSGEYWRSIHKKTDYFHIFDYWNWDEDVINETLSEYNWEWSNDTPTSWRIGDATAAFYNYIYYTVAGFTEHDTFRSNQVREGDVTRERALELVAEENRPRYESIRWYLDAVGIDFIESINVINDIPKLYETGSTALSLR